MKPVINADLTCNRDALCAVFGVSDAMITAYNKKGLPRIKTGLYSLPDCVQFVIDLSQGKAEGKSDLQASQIALNDARTKRVELDIETDLRNLVPISDARAALQALSSFFVSGLEALPPRCSQALAEIGVDPGAAEELIEVEINELRNQLAAELDDNTAALDTPSDDPEDPTDTAEA